MPTYLVESYEAQARPYAAVAALLAGGTGARHHWSLVLLEDEICLHVLDAPSAEVVRAAIVRAELRCQRISEVELIHGRQLEGEGGSR
jgi:hypothetical protein